MQTVNRTAYRKPDPCAPRYKPKMVNILSVSNKDFFVRMKKQYPQLAKYSNTEISKALEFYNNRLGQEVLNNRNGLRLPCGLGIIVAGSCSYIEDMGPMIDHKKSAELGVRVPYSNLHTDGLIAKVKYTNELDSHMFNNHKMWMFDASRNLSRALSKEFKKGNAGNYIHFTTRQHIGHLFRKTKIPKQNKLAAERKMKNLDNYDEFGFN